LGAVTSGGTNNGECVRTGFAAKEAREAILAFTAGAQQVLGPDGKPQRFGDVGRIPVLEALVGPPHAQR